MCRTCSYFKAGGTLSAVSAALTACWHGMRSSTAARHATAAIPDWRASLGKRGRAAIAAASRDW